MLTLKERILKHNYHNNDIKFKNEFLFLSEPISQYAYSVHGDENYNGFTEISALQFFLKNIHYFEKNNPTVCIRMHPSDTKNKYNHIINNLDIDISISTNFDLLEDILESNIIIGCNTMAMSVALVANKRVISIIPPGGNKCLLPHDGIESFQEIINNL